MKENFVVDTGVLSLFFSGDQRVRPYFERIESNRAECFVCSVTLSEYYYKTCQKLGKDVATIRYHQSRNFLRVVETDAQLALGVGLQKCRRSELSLADSFALATARYVHAILLTTDSELSKVKDIQTKLFEVKD